MDNNINFDIEQIRQKKREIASIEEKIENKRKAFEEIIQPLIDTVDGMKNELYILFERSIPIRLGDLLEELALLFEISVSDIYVDIEVDISCYGKHNMLEMRELMREYRCEVFRTNNMIMMLDLFSCNEKYVIICEPVFEYYACLPINLEEYQFDGRKLIDYCSIKYDYDDRGVFTKLVINNDIENIICNFNLGYLDKVDIDSWKPTDMFVQAIVNCLDKKCNLVRKK